MAHRLTCLVLLLVGMVTRASAQSLPFDDALDEKLSRSHLLDMRLFGLPTGNAEELFLQRLKTIHNKEIGEAAGKQLPPELLDQVLQNRDFVEKYLKNFRISS